MDNSQKNKLIQMIPTLAFVIGYFFFHLFDWMEVSQVIAATWVSMFSFMFLATDLKMEHKGKANFAKLSFYSGLLTLFSVLIFAQGFLHWNRLLSRSSRMGILIILMLMFFFALFRGMRYYMELKSEVEKSN